MRNAQIEIADIAGQVDALRQAFEMQMAELRAQHTELAEKVKALQQHPPDRQQPAAAVRVAPPPQVETKATEPQVREGVQEEIMLVIAAAVAAFLGKSARVRSARYLHEGMSPWAQQGRVFVQASHNLAHHG